MACLVYGHKGKEVRESWILSSGQEIVNIESLSLKVKSAENMGSLYDPTMFQSLGGCQYWRLMRSKCPARCKSKNYNQNEPEGQWVITSQRKSRSRGPKGNTGKRRVCKKERNKSRRRGSRRTKYGIKRMIWERKCRSLKSENACSACTLRTI